MDPINNWAVNEKWQRYPTLRGWVCGLNICVMGEGVAAIPYLEGLGVRPKHLRHG